MSSREQVIAIIGIIVTIVLAIIGWKYYYPSDFRISVNPMNGQVQPNGVIATAITITGENGYKESVSLSAIQQPSGIVVSFTPPIGGAEPSYTSNVLINVGSNVQAGTYIIKIKGQGADGNEHSTDYTLYVIPAPTTSTQPPTLTPTITNTPTSSQINTPVPPSFTPINVTDAFLPSGFMGDSSDITLDESSTENPYSKPTSIKITYSATGSQGKGWAGIYWQYPGMNWGDKPEFRDLTGATKLTFWVRGNKGGEKAEFKAGGIEGKYPDSLQPPMSTGIIILSDKWQQYTIDLKGKDLSHIIGGFVWVANKNQNLQGSVIYLDDMKYE